MTLIIMPQNEQVDQSAVYQSTSTFTKTYFTSLLLCAMDQRIQPL